jgi:hypothetical protein
MWKMKCFVIPVINWATGIVSKSLQKYLETIPGQHSIDSLQKNCHTGNITHHKESATSWDLKPEWWGSPLAQEEGKKENLWQEIIIIIIIIDLMPFETRLKSIGQESWKWWQYTHLKRQFTSSRQYCAIIQRVVIFVGTYRIDDRSLCKYVQWIVLLMKWDNLY